MPRLSVTLTGTVNVSVSTAPCRFLLRGLAALVLQFSLVEAHARIVVEWGRPSIHKMDV